MSQDQTPAEDRQDPADQYQTDTAVETEAQPGADEDGFGGDAPEPAEPAAVQTEVVETTTVTETPVTPTETS